MASGPGFFDAEGVWQYGEADTESLASDMLNLGQASVSDQFTIDRARMHTIEGDADHLPARAFNSSASRDTYWSTLLGFAGSTPANATERLALQAAGPQAVRTDKGWAEAYFADYDDGGAGANPQGAKTPGWYPVAGNLPGGRMVRSATAQTLATGSYTVFPAAAWSDALAGAQKPNGLAVPFATNGGWVAPFEGVYDVDVWLQVASTGNGAVLLKKNDAAASNVGLVMASSHAFHNTSTLWCRLTARVALAPGDILRAAFLTGTSATIGATPVDAAFGFRFVEPLRG